MTDRELLELAAKAVFAEFANQMIESGWNPLTDDGDALRLAVKLRLNVGYDYYDDIEYAMITPPHTHQGYDCLVDQDPYAATRRAIVRAAAEIGKSMP